jgi:amidohydrolase
MAISSEWVGRLSAAVDGVLPGVDELYLDLHRHPELSGEEERTADVVADRLRDKGFEVTERVGGFGVAAVLRNGDGPVVGLRGDMDALPVFEETGLPYASENPGVMHACGHDMHTSCLVGAAEVLAATREHWSGTVLVIGQPSEEAVSGADAMLRDGLFTRFPRPDVVLGQHVTPAPAGTLLHRSGPLYAAARNFRVVLHGRGAHGALPQYGVDPVVLAARVVLDLQTIVSRETSPNDIAVVTVGSIHGGTRPNIIPPSVTLEITTRGASEKAMDAIEASLRRIVHAACAGAGAPREPEITLIDHVFATVNDAEPEGRVRAAHRALFGEAVTDLPFLITGSEDFGEYGAPGPDHYPEPAIPTYFWLLGVTPPQVWADAPGEELTEKFHGVPSPHQDVFAPDREHGLRIGVAALAAGALAYLAG